MNAGIAGLSGAVCSLPSEPVTLIDSGLSFSWWSTTAAGLADSILTCSSGSASEIVISSSYKSISSCSLETFSSRLMSSKLNSNPMGGRSPVEESARA